MGRLRSIRFVIAWVPIALVGFWGFSFLHMVLLTTFAPGLPFSVIFHTQGGNLTLKGDSFSLQPRAGIYQFDNLQLYDPHHKLLASVKNLAIRGPSLFHLSDGPYQIRARNGFVRLVRSKNGQFQFQKYLPKKTSSRSAIATDFHANTIRVLYQDNSGTAPFQQDAVLSHIQFSSFQGSYLGAAQAKLANVGQLGVSFALPKNGSLQVIGRKARLSLYQVPAPLLTLLQKQNPTLLAQAHFKTLLLTGNCQVNRTPSGKISGDAQFVFDAQNPGYKIYKANTFEFRGTASLGAVDAVQGLATAKTNGSIVRSQVQANWTHGLYVSGRFQTQSASLQQLLADARQSAISHLQANSIRATGDFQYSRQNGFCLQSNGNIQTASYQGNSLSNIGVRASFQNHVVRFDAQGVSPRLGPVSGKGYYQVKSSFLSLFIDADHTHLDKLEALLPDQTRKETQLSGPADAEVNISGPIQDLHASYRAEATGQISSSRLTRPVEIQGLALIGSYQKGIANVQRLWLKTNSGTAWGHGAYSLKSKTISAALDGRAFPLNLASVDLNGYGSLSGSVSGAINNPKFLGKVEVYDAEYKGNGVTIAHGNVSASRSNIQISNFEALRRASLISGNLGLDLNTMGINGALSGQKLWMADFFGNNFLGAFSASVTNLSGTLTDPHAHIVASGSNLFAKTIPLKQAAVMVDINHHQISLTSSSLSLNPGTCTLTGNYNWKSDEGSGVLTSTHLDFGKLLAEGLPSEDYHFAGQLNGSSHFDFSKAGIKKASGSGTIANAALNTAPVGDGPWNFDYSKKALTGNIQISHEMTFLSLENAKLSDFQSQNGPHLSGTLLASSISLANLKTALQPLVSQLPGSTQRKLFGVDGLLQSEVDFSGDLNDPNHFEVQIPAFTASNLERSSTQFGTVNLTGSLKNGEYQIQNGTYADGSASGSFDLDLIPNKSVKADGELDGFNLSKLLTFFPQSPSLNGIASVSFVASGNPNNPKVRASALAQNISYGTKTTVFGLNLDDIRANNGLLTAQGDLTYNGFVGKIKGLLPYQFGSADPKSTVASANISLDNRPVQDLQPYFPELASKLGAGSFGGHLEVQGTDVNNAISQVQLTGQLIAEGTNLGFQVPQSLFSSDSKKYLPLNTKLAKYRLSANIVNGQIAANLEAKSSEGGTIHASAKTTLSGLDAALSQGSRLKPGFIWESPLSGKVQLSNFAVRENNADLSTSGHVNGTIDLAGTLKKPVIGGELLVSNLSTTIPAITPSQTTSSAPTIDPSFDVKFGITGIGTIKTALASIGMTGVGTLKGTLSNPAINANLNVAKGQFRLPGGVVRLQPGGTVTGIYADNGLGLPTAQLLIDIYGETHVTAAPSPDQIQRYDVSLEIHGDLMDPNNVQISASSDPPDLSQTEILNLLGRTDILNALNGTSSSRQGALQNALTGYALPTLLEPITSSLAKGLGLDYLSLEYDPFGQTSVLLGRQLGGGFSISLRRQISAPIPGFPLYYDYRLNYHPAFLGQRFRSFNFLLGTDQQNLWKVGFQYSIRF